MENYGPAAGTQGFQGAPPPPPAPPGMQPPAHQPPAQQSPAQQQPQPGQQWPQFPPPGGQGGPPQPQRQPNPKRRKRLVIAGSVAGGLLVLLGVGGYFGYKYMDETVYSPRIQAEEYLQALVDGELEKALDMVPADPSLDNTLMTDEIYSKVTNRISGFEITDVVVDGDTAEVMVDVKQGGESEAMKLSLSKAGTEAVLFNKWKVDAPLGTWSLRYILDPDASEPAVNGVAIEVPEDGRKFAVMPGDYTFNAPAGTKFISYGGDEKMSVGLDSQESLMGVGFTPEITDAAREEIKAQTSARMRECVASTDLIPKGCPNQMKDQDPNNFRNVQWSMTREPRYDSIEGSPIGPFRVESVDGEFALKADMKVGDGWEPQEGTVMLYSFPAEVYILGDELTMLFAE